MSLKKITLFLTLFILFSVLVSLALVLSKYDSQPGQVQPSPTIIVNTPNYNFPITQRTFTLGVAGYTPLNFPDSNFSDIRNFWQDVNDAGEDYAIHVDWKDTSQVASSMSATNKDITLVLGYQDPEEWDARDSDFLQTAQDLLSDFPQIKYLGIGNEINLLYENHKNEFNTFVEAFKYFSSEIKISHPEVKIFTVFNYETLRGEGYLTGQADQREPSWLLLNEFESHADFIAFTSYPFLDFADPNLIPSNYYAPIKEYTQLPIAFTEIGWVSDSEFSGGAAVLNETDFTGSEQEQVDFLMRFLETINGLDVIFVHWAFIHDLPEQISVDLYDSIALKKNSGEFKAIWPMWLDLKYIPRVSF